MSYAQVNREFKEGVVYEDLENVAMSVKRERDQLEHQDTHDNGTFTSQPAAAHANDRMDVTCDEGTISEEEGIQTEDV